MSRTNKPSEAHPRRRAARRRAKLLTGCGAAVLALLGPLATASISATQLQPMLGHGRVHMTTTHTHAKHRPPTTVAYPTTLPKHNRR